MYPTGLYAYASGSDSQTSTQAHQLAHRGLEVVVANDATGDSRSAGAGVGLVEDEDVGA